MVLVFALGVDASAGEGIIGYNRCLEGIIGYNRCMEGIINV